MSENQPRAITFRELRDMLRCLTDEQLDEGVAVQSEELPHGSAWILACGRLDETTNTISLFTYEIPNKSEAIQLAYERGRLDALEGMTPHRKAYQWDAKSGTDAGISWTIYDRDSVGIDFGHHPSMRASELGDMIVRLSYIRKAMFEA